MAERRDSVTPCCNYTIRDEDPVVKWNPYNGVVQCHSCGEIYIPNKHRARGDAPDGIDVWAWSSLRAAEFAREPPPAYDCCEICGASDASTANGSSHCKKCDTRYPLAISSSSDE